MKDKKSVLITGASSGIGETLALTLDKIGFKVFAGVRTKNDQKRLSSQGSTQLHVLLLDVTQEKSIQDAFTYIENEKEYPLFALVNNAGVGLRGVLEVTPLDEVRKLFDVNVIGLYAMTQTFLPLLRKGKGRIINIGSEAGLMAGANGSAYSASKFAVRAISDSLRMELVGLNVWTIYIAPTSIESSIWKKNILYREKLLKMTSEKLQSTYRYFFNALKREVVEIVQPLSQDVVINDIVDALTSSHPKHEYYSGKKAKKAYEMSLLDKERLTRCAIKRQAKFIKMYG